MTIHPLPSSPERPGVSAAPLAPDTNSEAVEADSKEVLPAPADPLRHDGWTPARQAAFLRELAATHNVGAAARAVGMSRQSAYKLRARLRGTPFDKGWEAAFVTRFDVLAEAALDRALNGVEVPHYYNGELIGTSRRYDERLTLALLAMRGSFVRKPVSDYDPSSAFESDDLAALSDRVEQGPEAWRVAPDEELDVRYGVVRNKETDEADETDETDETGEADEAEETGEIDAADEAGLADQTGAESCHANAAGGGANMRSVTCRIL